MTITLNHKNIFAFADTHGRHRELKIPADTDILVCAGDVCDMGNEWELQDFFDWFAEQTAKHKLFVAGNHDLPFDIDPEYAARYIPKGVAYLESGGIMLDGIRFYILPVQPWMQGIDIPAYMPQNIEVLVTHGAPMGILDEGYYGCHILRRLADEAQPNIHIFGHCHQEGGKCMTVGKTRFYNVAVIDKERDFVENKLL
jgi:Icc-related predicted phosphoesterase